MSGVSAFFTGWRRTAVGFGLAAILLSLALLPPVKGMFVALQWVKGMHGFDPTRTAARPASSMLTVLNPKASTPTVMP